MENFSILFTGAGSTMGQSLIKALLMSDKYKDIVDIHVTNSEPMGAGYIVPIAKAPDYIDRIIQICKENNIKGIFSGTEHEIYALSKNAERIKNESGAIVFLSRLEVIDIGTDKLKTYEFFKKHDLPFPETALFDDYKSLVEKVGYPLFMKPRTASASRNIFKIEKEEDLFKYKFAPSDEIILQEFLDSKIEYTVETFCDKTGKVVGTIPMVRELDFGMSYSGEINDNKESIEVSERIARALKPEGALNVQLRLVNGKAIPFEINTRFSSTECVRAHYGYNSIEAMLDNYLFDKEIDLSNWKKGMFMRYWHECYMTKEELPE